MSATDGLCMQDAAWAPQDGPQSDLCLCPCGEVFFGGARGGGKTDGMLGKWALKERRYGQHFNAIAFRPTAVSFEDAIDRSKQIYGPLGGEFVGAPRPRWRMPNGGRVVFAYLESVQDAQEYQGRNLTDAWVEEGGLYADPKPIDRLFGVLRSAYGVPTQLVITANPGGPGQHWIRERYRIHPFPRRPLVFSRGGHNVAVIPSRITDNKILLSNDPGYIDRLRLVGSPELVRAWLEGDWSAVEGAFFAEWSEDKHVIPPFSIPDNWLRFRSADWGSYSPFSIGWWAVVTDDYQLEGGADYRSERLEAQSDARLRGRSAGIESAAQRDASLDRSRADDLHRFLEEAATGVSARIIPRGAIVRYREWYGKVGGKLTAEQVGDGIVEREKGDKQRLTYGVLDPSAFAEAGGPSIAERINKVLITAKLAPFRQADNRRVARNIGDPQKAGPMGGWDQVRSRLNGVDGKPMLYVFSTCRDLIRTLPVAQHDPVRAEDLDTNAEDHCFTGDTCISTDKGVRSFVDLLGTEGRVLSHDGCWHKFRSVRLVKRNEPIVRLTFDDGSVIRCTPDHDFLTSVGWVQAKDLKGQSILSLSRKLLRSLKGKSTGYVESTLNGRTAKTAGGSQFTYTIKSGLKTEGLFQKDFTSITLIMIAATMRSITLTAFRPLIICRGRTVRKILSVLESFDILNALKRQHVFGMALTKVLRGIKSIMNVILSPFGVKNELLFVGIAGVSIPRTSGGNFAQISAGRLGAGRAAEIMSSASARFVVQSSWPIDTQRSKRVRENVGPFPALALGPVCLSVEPAGREDVYCLTVPSTGCFALAGGMITSNCLDDLRYGCMSRPWIKVLPKPERVKDGYQPAAQERDDTDSILLL